METGWDPACFPLEVSLLMCREHQEQCPIHQEAPALLGSSFSQEQVPTALLVHIVSMCPVPNLPAKQHNLAEPFRPRMSWESS